MYYFINALSDVICRDFWEIMFIFGKKKLSKMMKDFLIHLLVSFDAQCSSSLSLAPLETVTSSSTVLPEQLAWLT